MFRLLMIVALLLLMTTTTAQDDDMPEDTTDLVAGNNAFAFDLYQSLPKPDDTNVLYSPYSISQAFALAYAGAQGETESQIADVMHYTLSQDDLHPAFSDLNTNLTERTYPNLEVAEDEEESDLKTFKLNIANALWGQQDYPFDTAYLETVDDNYNSGFHEIDFAADPEGARDEINDWVSEQTEDRIQDIVPPGAINGLTRLVLANAIYFNASWLRPFPEFATQDSPFFLLDGEEVTVPMMQQQETFLYAQGENYKALELPYLGGDVAMMIVLPDEGAFEDVEAAINSEFFSELRQSLSGGNEVQVFLPRFEYEFDISLNNALIDMGMTDPFDTNNANFNGMFTEIPEGNIYISDALHKAFIKVDECGTEAAAATVLVMRATSAMPSEPVEFRVDRPFIFTIYDRVTGSVLFVGRVMNPA